MAMLICAYPELVEPIVAKLKANGIADTDSLRTSHTYRSTGRYLRLHDKFGVWLGVPLRAWRDSGGITPLWMRIDRSEEFSGINNQEWNQIESVFGHKVKGNEDSKFIPIRLKLGVERESVIDYAVEQIGSMAKKLEEAMRKPPADPSSVLRS